MIKNNKRFSAFNILIGLLSIITMGPAQALKIDMHVHIGQKILEDAEDGFLNIQYGDGIRMVKLNRETHRALQDYPKAFLAGTVGPDFYPDLIAGQSAIHPGAEGGWVSHVFFSETLENVYRIPTDNTNSKQRLAFTLGMLVHASSDTFAHSFVNTYTGDEFSIFDGEIDNEARHILLEGYLSELILSEEQKESIADNYDDLSELPVDWIVDNFIRNQDFLDQYNKNNIPHLQFMKDRLSESNGEKSTSEKSLRDVIDGVVKIPGAVDDVYKEINKLFNAFKDLDDAHEEAVREWVIANHKAAEAVFDGKSVTQPYERWLACYGLAFGTLNEQFVDTTCGVYDSYNKVKEIIVLVDRAISQVGGVVYRNLMPASVRRQVDRIKGFVNRQGINLAEVILGEEIVDIYLLWQKNPTREEVTQIFSRDESNKNLLIINDIADRIEKATASAAENHDINLFPLTFNALQLSKLALLNHEELNQIFGEEIFSEGERFIIGETETLDGNHQWLKTPPPLPRRNISDLEYPSKTFEGMKIYTRLGHGVFNKIFKGPLNENLLTKKPNYEDVLPKEYPYKPCASHAYPNGTVDKTCAFFQSQM